MKKVIFSFLLIVIFIAANAQHTLSFNQALLVSNQQTVPQGAVWKVISIMPSSGSISTTSGTYYVAPSTATFSITVNSNPVYFSTVYAAAEPSDYGYTFAYTSASGDGKLPMWLPAGTTLAASSNIQYISVIEFLVN